MNKTYHFPVIVEIDEDGVYIVSCPTLKAVILTGKQLMRLWII
jgi:predicted RNase H-like HicB family nuclease